MPGRVVLANSNPDFIEGLTFNIQPLYAWKYGENAYPGLCTSTLKLWYTSVRRIFFNSACLQTAEWFNININNYSFFNYKIPQIYANRLRPPDGVTTALVLRQVSRLLAVALAKASGA